MIATKEIAAAALAGNLPLFREGTSRYVYELDGWVYKVDFPNDVANAYELSNLIRFNDVEFPDFIRIPDHMSFDFDGTIVIAMEFIEGYQLFECFCGFAGLDCVPACEEDRVPDKVADFFHSIDITDIGNGNIVTRDGIYYLIDAAE